MDEFYCNRFENGEFLDTNLGDDSICPAFADGLVAHYKLNESIGTTASDETGAHPGTTVGNPAWTAGHVDGGITLDGADDYVDLGTFDVTGTAMTITAWINADDFNVSDARILSKAIGTAEQDHYWMVSAFNGNSFRFRLKTNGVTGTIYGNQPIQAGSWAHVAAVYDGAEMRLYTNGVLSGTLAKTGAISTNASAGVRIGDNPGATRKLFDGTIDDVRIYSRALSATDINDLVGDLPPVPTATLTASPTYINPGESVTLTWNSTFTESCTGTGFDTADATSGSVSVTPTSNTGYSISCTGEGGTTGDSTFVTMRQPSACADRGRPQVQNNTIVSDTGERLRGTTFWAFASHGFFFRFAQDFENWQLIADSGFNAVRLATNRYNPDQFGDPVYLTDQEWYEQIAVWVDWAAELGLYIIIDHHEVGGHTQSLLRTFWSNIAPRFADRKHVIYEIANEPVAWRPSDYTAQDVADFQELHDIIRTHAPDNHIVFFTFAVPSTGMETLADQLTGVDWTKASVGFHGYWENTSQGIRNLKAQYPVFNTEWMKHTPEHPESANMMDGYLWQSELMENLEISWLSWDANYKPDSLSLVLTPLLQHAADNDYMWQSDLGNTCVTSSTTATLTASPTSITEEESAILTWSSYNADSCTGTGFSTDGATSGSVSVSPTQTTTYTLACTGAGGTNSDNATVDHHFRSLPYRRLQQ
jgi:hypothetical protein